MVNTLIMHVETLLAKATTIGLIEKRDLIYFRNHYAQLFGYELGNETQQINPKLEQLNLADITNQIYHLLDGNQITSLGNTKEQIETRIIDELMPAQVQSNLNSDKLNKHKELKLHLIGITY